MIIMIGIWNLFHFITDDIDYGDCIGSFELEFNFFGMAFFLHILYKNRIRLAQNVRMEITP